MKSAAESEQTYVECLSRRVPGFGRRVAAKFHHRELTYLDLNERANRLAHYLISLGIGPETLVSVCVERSLDALVALLSVWKAGGAFVPLDPAYPVERLAYLLADSQAQILLVNARSKARVASLNSQAVSIDELPNLEQFPAHDPPGCASADNLAYVLYTSGSTGMPKGVAISHRSLLNHNRVVSQAYHLCATDRVLQFASLSFDVALEEIFPAWLCGSTLVVRPPDVISSGQEFLRFVAREQISVLNLPTAYWHELMSDLPSGMWPSCVRLVVIGGEKAAERAFERWKQVVPPEVKLINAYGPTEATITALMFEADRTRADLPIGRPLANSYAAVFDHNLRRVPAGTVGELFLGGVGLARGYFRRPKLTLERFIPNPETNLIPSKRLYRTGDLVRVGPDGNFEFIGRADDQVKIRGFRIEPGEIATALRECPLVKDAVIAAREDQPGHKQLVAYFVPRPKQSPSVTELVQFLRGRVPAYMVPAAFLSLEALPLTPAGKVDWQALPSPNQARPILAEQKVAARTGMEHELTAIWQEVLPIKEVGVHDDFFELGGDSLLALQILGRVRKRFGMEIELSDFFVEPNVAGLARALERAPAAQVVPSGTGSDGTRKTDPAPASLIQRQLFFLQEMDLRSDAYHIGSVLRLRGRLNIDAFEQALNHVVARHEALRSRLDYHQGKLCQFVAATLRVPVSLISLAHVPRRGRSAELQRRLSIEVRRPFHLGTAPLLRVSLLRFNEAEHVLLIVLHHSIADGWSLGILLRELQQAYVALSSSGSTPPRRNADCQYADFAHHQEQMLKRPEAGMQLEFWRQTLAEAPRAVAWPKTRLQEAPGTCSQPSERITLRLAARTVLAATTVFRVRRVTPFMGLLGAMAISLWKCTGQTDQVIGTVIAGRNRQEFENVIGCFMNFLPIRLRLQANHASKEFLDHVRRSVLAAQSHQDCPFEQIVSASGMPCSSARNPLFNVALLWHNYPPGNFTPPGIAAEPLPLPPRQPLLDLRLEAEPCGAEWLIAGEYDPTLFERLFMERFLKSFKRALRFLTQTQTTALEEFMHDESANGGPRFWFFLPTLRRWKLRQSASSCCSTRR